MKKFWLSLGIALMLTCWCGVGYYGLGTSPAFGQPYCLATPTTLIVTMTIMPRPMRTHFPNCSTISPHQWSETTATRRPHATSATKATEAAGMKAAGMKTAGMKTAGIKTTVNANKA